MPRVSQQELLKLLDLLIEASPVRHRQELLDQRARLMPEPHDPSRKNTKLSEFWIKYKDTQKFLIEVRGEGDEVITGLDNLCLRIHRNRRYVRQKFANGKGRFYLNLEDQVLTITRLTTQQGAAGVVNG